MVWRRRRVGGSGGGGWVVVVGRIGSGVGGSGVGW